MRTAFFLELYFLGLSFVVAYVGVRHLRTYWEWAQAPESALDLPSHRRFVAIQMWCSIAFLATFVPALAIGLYHAHRDPGLLSVLPIPLYFVPRLILRRAKTMEEELRNLVAEDPDVQEQLDRIAYVWKNRLLPRF